VEEQDKENQIEDKPATHQPSPPPKSPDIQKQKMVKKPQSQLATLE